MIVQAVRLSDADDVANVLGAASVGTSVELVANGANIAARTVIPKHHKIALRSIKSGEKILRGGMTIGVASTDIPIGAHVHVHNIKSLRANASQGDQG